MAMFNSYVSLLEEKNLETKEIYHDIAHLCCHQHGEPIQNLDVTHQNVNQTDYSEIN